MTPDLKRTCWQPSWRLVSSRFPPASVFDRVANADDFDIVTTIEGLTNDRLRDELGELSLIPEEDRIYGAGTTPIMAAFTHLNVQGSRFTDGSYGVYYAAKTIETAVAETRFHRSRFLAATREPPTEIDMRSYASDIDAELHNIVGQQQALADIYIPDPAQYSIAQGFARQLRGAGSNGIHYSSVRDPGGECIAIFRPRLMAPAVQGKHYCYVWDGERITDVYVKTAFP